MSISRVFLPALLLAAGLSCAVAEDGAAGGAGTRPKPETIALDACPAAVKEAITKAAAGAKIETVGKMTRDGKSTYVVAIPGADGKSTRVRFAEDGTVMKGRGKHGGEGEKKEGEKKEGDK